MLEKTHKDLFPQKILKGTCEGCEENSSQCLNNDYVIDIVVQLAVVTFWRRNDSEKLKKEADSVMLLILKDS